MLTPPALPPACSFPPGHPTSCVHCIPKIRPKAEFQRSTFHGAIVSLFLMAVVSLLIWRELRFSMQTETVESLFVNATIAPKVTIT